MRRRQFRKRAVVDSPMADPQAMADPQEVLDLRPGEMVRVRSAPEIFSTLDERGALDNLPFMPEMLRYGGQTFSVTKRADKTCGPDHGLRRMTNTVFLTKVSCDGSGHGSCQAGCLLYWKEASLERARSSGSHNGHKLGEREQAFVDGILRPAAVNSSPSRADDDRVVWSCQATESPRASMPLHGWQLNQYPRDARNWGPLKVVRTLAVEAFNRMQSFSRRRLPSNLLLKRGRPHPLIAGALEKGQAPLLELSLQPGDRVRIKSTEEIVKTLDATSHMRGLSFDNEMVKYCGRIATVRSRVNRLIDQETGRMLRIQADCIILEGVTCEAEGHRLCPRGVYPYWREAWLERLA
jgi:hypothetical protein